MQPAPQTSADQYGHRDQASTSGSGATNPTSYSSQTRHARPRRAFNASTQRPAWSHYFNLR